MAPCFSPEIDVDRVFGPGKREALGNPDPLHRPIVDLRRDNCRACTRIDEGIDRCAQQLAIYTLAAICRQHAVQHDLARRGGHVQGGERARLIFHLCDQTALFAAADMRSRPLLVAVRERKGGEARIRDVVCVIACKDPLDE